VKQRLRGYRQKVGLRLILIYPEHYTMIGVWYTDHEIREVGRCLAVDGLTKYSRVGHGNSVLAVAREFQFDNVPEVTS
jgi:hypothetical protein